MMRFTFPKHGMSRIQLDLARRIGGSSTEQQVSAVGEKALEGWVRCGPEGGGMGNGVPKDLKYRLFFRAKLSRPLKEYGIWKTPVSGFWNPYYNHSNEPVHQLVYIFACTGRAWLTQKWSRSVTKNAYSLGPEGLCGNDDVGQMSAWYLLASSTLI